MVLLSDNITIYILTHKKFDYEESDIYKPLLNGSALLDEDFGYIRDDTGDNISELNIYYAELTGEYWAWKNSDADIIGFCHYRRYFVKNIFLEKLDENDIKEILKDYDIILPEIRHLHKPVIEDIHDGHLDGACHKKEDYYLLREIIEEECPEYLESFDELLNGKEIYWFNMYILRKELFDEYCEWMFNLLEIFRQRNDFSQYEEGNARVLGYLSERLLNVYVKKNNLKVKEKLLHLTESRNPILAIMHNRYAFFQRLHRA